MHALRSSLDNPAAHAPTPTKQLTFAYLVPINAYLLLYPWPLFADWALGTVPLIESYWDSRNIVTALFFASFVAATLIVVFKAPLDRHLAFCFAMIIVPFIPASNLFFPVGFVVGRSSLGIGSFSSNHDFCFS